VARAEIWMTGDDAAADIAARNDGAGGTCNTKLRSYASLGEHQTRAGMAPEPSFGIIDVDADNVAETGFFCLRSKRDAAGYRRKLGWLEARFAEGLRIKLATGGWRGFIEYTPGPVGWRAVHAADYMLIHCLWVTGRSKGAGLGSALLDHAIADARSLGLAGVAVVTSDATWLAGPQFYAKHGFELLERAPPAFALMAQRFEAADAPCFPTDWDARAAACGPGLTVLRTDQCPYLADSVDLARALAAARGLSFREVTLESVDEVRRCSPSAYGVFAMVLDGRFLDYRPRNRVELEHLLSKA
jgi:GNAT superfamily N-acetyltransferase